MTTPHSSLTGLDLHEPKGADSASANQVYVANGLGGGTWQKLDGNSLATTANPFGKQLLHVREQQASSVNSPVILNASVWSDRTFNTTLTNEIPGASISITNVTLPAGTYYFEAYSIGNLSTAGFQKLRLYDATTPVVLIEGVHTGVSTTSDNVSISLRGRFTLPLAKVVRLEQFTNQAGNGGIASTAGSVEVYCELLVWKLA
jgi:hypothetical protein